MRYILLLIVGSLLSTSSLKAQTADAILGKWTNPTGEAHILIYRTGNTYSGKLNWLKPSNNENRPINDVNNPDKSLRNKPLLGLELLKGFEHKGGGSYEEGTIYDPKNGKTYSCKMTLNGDKLKIRGYIGVSLLGRSEVWTRVK